MARPKVNYSVEVEQDWTEVRGNAMVSGDDAADKEVEDEILDRLSRGDVWAWAEVTVVAECQGFKGSAHLCGCCYKDEADFRADGGYFPQMKKEALAALRLQLQTEANRGEQAAKLLARFG